MAVSSYLYPFPPAHMNREATQDSGLLEKKVQIPVDLDAGRMWSLHLEQDSRHTGEQHWHPPHPALAWGLGDFRGWG